MPTTDLASHTPWLESQRRSRSRRFAAVRRLRRQRGRRAGAGVLLASLTIAAGGALAADGSGGSSARTGTRAVHAAGSSVSALQQALGITADGIYGPQTRRAVRRFQRAHDLAVDGIAGPETLGALGISGRSTGDSTTHRRGTATVLARIARCESGGDPAAISSSGRYRGKYQFTRATWHDLGGTGDPADASETKQDRIARALYRQRGTTPWPICGRS